jgi:membrane protease YdiL (CAAX protease family)
MAMTPKTERVPPSPQRTLLLGAAALIGYGLFRWFTAHELPDTSQANRLPRDLAVTLGAVACAVYLYWLGRLRYSGQVLRRAPGLLAAPTLAVLGLSLAAICLQWDRPPADFAVDSLVFRVAGVLTALAEAACEEFGFRGTLFVAFEEVSPRWGRWAAVAAGSLGFVAVHAGFQGTWELGPILGAGLVLGLARLKGASLPLLVAAHALMSGTEAVWMSPTLGYGHDAFLIATGTTLATALVLWFLPAAPPLEKGGA